MRPSLTLAVSIDCPPARVAQFVADPRHLPLWATAFCRAVQQIDDDWIVDTAQGQVGIRFAAANDFGILDHDVTLASGEKISVPMRVVANGAGSEVLFTLFQLPGMSAEQFAEDQAAVARDLHSLKRCLETR